MTSIIIPVYNAEKYLAGLLESLKSQTVQCEIIVIDSSSSDSTVKIAGSYSVKVISIKKEDFDHGGTRTLAAKSAQGDILVYLTQDAMPADEHSVENLIRPFENPATGAAYGRQVPEHNATVFGAHLRLFNYPEKSCIKIFSDKESLGIKTPFLSNSFTAYRKKALDDIGYFKDGLISSEDIYAGAKILILGYEIAYVAEAAVYHSHNYTAFEEFKRYVDIGVCHQREKWILKKFGRAEGEGGKYIRSEISFLIKNKKYCLIPVSFVRNGLKYTGYSIGRHYENIPKNRIKKISMNKGWWDRF